MVDVDASFEVESLGWLVKYFLKHHPEIRHGIFPGVALVLHDSLRRAVSVKRPSGPPGDALVEASEHGRSAVAACGGQTTSGGTVPSIGGTIDGKPVTAAKDGWRFLGRPSTARGRPSKTTPSPSSRTSPTPAASCRPGGTPRTPRRSRSRSSTRAAPLSRRARTRSTEGSAHGGCRSRRSTSCKTPRAPPRPSENAESGTITFSTVSASLLAGSFDVTFPSGDHLKGSFASPICDAVPGQGQADPVCKSY